MPRKRRRNKKKKSCPNSNKLKMLREIYERIIRFALRVIDRAIELNMLLYDWLEIIFRNRLVLFLIFFCFVMAFKKPNPVKKPRASLPLLLFSPNVSSPPPYDPWDIDASVFLSPFLSNDDYNGDVSNFRSLEYDFYRDTCPQAEKIIRDVVQEAFKIKSDVAPQLLRLAFHDCFIEGCDGSILLDPGDGIDSEKGSPPNESVKGFEVIDMIKSAVEEVCPGVVSCSDIVVLAARNSIVSSGGPFYPIRTGRKDGNEAFHDLVIDEMPSPHSDLSEILAAFASRGFDERETVSLLGAHSMGVIHCKFFENRLHNFGGTNQPDPTLNADFLNILRSRCNIDTDDISTSPSAAPTPSHHSNLSPLAQLSSLDTPVLSPSAPQPSFSNSVSSAPRTLPPLFESKTSLSGPTRSSPKNSFKSSHPSSPSPSISASLKRMLLSSQDEQGMSMAYEGPGVDFGALYYRSLIQGRGILYADQQLMAGEETRLWVRVYASDLTLFRRDFAQAMMKLSELQVLTGSMGQVRRHCSRVA